VYELKFSTTSLKKVSPAFLFDVPRSNDHSESAAVGSGLVGDALVSSENVAAERFYTFTVSCSRSTQEQMRRSRKSLYRLQLEEPPVDTVFLASVVTEIVC
jgi:hypothetical protein